MIFKVSRADKASISSVPVTYQRGGCHIEVQVLSEQTGCHGNPGDAHSNDADQLRAHKWVTRPRIVCKGGK